jgi:hypothetical protein
MPDTAKLSAALAEIGARFGARPGDVERLLAAVDAVLGRHVPKTLAVRHVCKRHGAMGWPGRPASPEQIDVCPDCTLVERKACAACDPVCPDDNEWPCADYLAISRALLGEESPDA